MINPSKFLRKPFYVDAVRVTEENIEEVAEWCEGEVRSAEKGRYIKVRVRRPLNVRQTCAHIGDWVLSAGSGFKVYTPKGFKESFDPAENSAPAQTEALFAEANVG